MNEPQTKKSNLIKCGFYAPQRVVVSAYYSYRNSVCPSVCLFVCLSVLVTRPGNNSSPAKRKTLGFYHMIALCLYLVFRDQIS